VLSVLLLLLAWWLIFRLFVQLAKDVLHGALINIEVHLIYDVLHEIRSHYIL